MNYKLIRPGLTCQLFTKNVAAAISSSGVLENRTGYNDANRLARLFGEVKLIAETEYKNQKLKRAFPLHFEMDEAANKIMAWTKIDDFHRSKKPILTIENIS